MKKQIKLSTFLLVVAILLICFFVCGFVVMRELSPESERDYKVTEDVRGMIYYEFSDGSVYTLHEDKIYVYSLDNYSGEVYVVPEEINGYKVTAILDYAYGWNKTIKTLIATHTGELSKVALESLNSVFIGENIDDIRSSSFIYSPNLRQITVDIRNEKYYSENNCVLLRKNNELVCTSMGMEKIPPSAKIVGGCSFTNLAITHLEIPMNIVEIQERSFESCNDLKALFISNSVQTMGASIFRNYDVENGTISPQVVVFCEAKEKPEGWNEDWWKDGVKEIRWGATKEEYNEYVAMMDD